MRGMQLLDFFTDPLLRAPTIGAMLICFTVAFVGVLVFIRRRSLLGEALSHASYPGVTLAIVVAGVFSCDHSLSILVIVGAFISSLIGLWAISFLEKRLKVAEDAALCAVLTLFFGVGIIIASYVQFSSPHLFRQIQMYLYGQSATMRDQDIWIYATLACVVVTTVAVFYKEIFLISFDRAFAQSLGIRSWLVEGITFFMIVLTLVIGIRTVGVVLMSAMLIAPAVAARQFTHKLSKILLLAGGCGVLSGLLGTVLSVLLQERMPSQNSLPTGPMIVLSAGGFAVYALLFAPRAGLVVRYLRVVRFRNLQVQENLLKFFWRARQEGEGSLSFSTLMKRQNFSSLRFSLLLFRLSNKGWVKRKNKEYSLTQLGEKRGGQLVRLHRLWEAYLVHSLGMKVEWVHKSAEEMEHILTPDLERRLTQLLDDPREDPHNQPIPPPYEAMHHV